MPFDTPLTTTEENNFAVWKNKYAPHDPGEDYDLRGAFKAGLTPDPVTGHWPDTYKKPNHETFSDESIYSSLTGTKPGHWQGEKYMAFDPTQESQAPQAPAFNPEAFNQLPGIIKLQGVQNMIENRKPGEDIFAKMTANRMKTGEYGKTFARMGIDPPFQVAMNQHAEDQLAVLAGGGNALPNQPKAIAPLETLKTDKNGTSELKGLAKTPAQLDTIRAEQLQIEKKLKGGETEHNKNRRLLGLPPE